MPPGLTIFQGLAANTAARMPPDERAAHLTRSSPTFASNVADLPSLLRSVADALKGAAVTGQEADCVLTYAIVLGMGQGTLTSVLSNLDRGDVELLAGSVDRLADWQGGPLDPTIRRQLATLRDTMAELERVSSFEAATKD